MRNSSGGKFQYKCHDDSNDQKKNDRSSDRISCFFWFLFSDVMPDYYGGAHCKACNDKSSHLHKGTSCSYCGNTRGISEFSNNQQINCAIRSLQDQCSKYGDSKPKQRLEHRSFCKTYFFFRHFFLLRMWLECFR